MYVYSSMLSSILAFSGTRKKCKNKSAMNMLPLSLYSRATLPTCGNGTYFSNLKHERLYTIEGSFSATKSHFSKFSFCLKVESVATTQD